MITLEMLKLEGELCTLHIEINNKIDIDFYSRSTTELAIFMLDHVFENKVDIMMYISRQDQQPPA